MVAVQRPQEVLPPRDAGTEGHAHEGVGEPRGSREEKPRDRGDERDRGRRIGRGLGEERRGREREARGPGSRVLDHPRHPHEHLRGVLIRGPGDEEHGIARLVEPREAGHGDALKVRAQGLERVRRGRMAFHSG